MAEYTLHFNDDDDAALERRAAGFGMSVLDYLYRCALATEFEWGGRPRITPGAVNQAAGYVTTRRVVV